MSTQYKIFLDDLRTVDMVYGPGRDHEFEIVRNVDDFKKIVEDRGVPDYISFDHDLGLRDNGEVMDAYEVVKWMVYDKEYDLRDMKFMIHSANPLAFGRINSLINNWNKELFRRDEHES